MIGRKSHIFKIILTLKEVFRHITILSYLLLGIVSFGHTQTENIIFSYYNMDDGLVHNHCKAMFKDETGFMWFGTEAGLSRFDGQNFKNFKHSDDDSTSIGGNWVNDIAEDKNGNIWIATMRGGLNMYNAQTGKFISYPLNIKDDLKLPTDELACLYIDQTNDIWYGTYRHGFGRFHPETDSFENYNLNTSFKNPRQAWSLNSPTSFLEDISNPDIMWIGSMRYGLYQFDKKSKTLTKFLNPYNKYGSGIHDLYMEKSGELWIGYWGLGIAKFDTKKHIWKMFIPDKEKFLKGDGYSNICIDITKKSRDEFWIAGGRDGLGVFNKETEKFYFIDPNKNFKKKTAQGFISQILTTSNDGVWIRDGINGIYQIDPARQYFRFVSTKAIKQKSREGLNGANDFAFDPVDKKYYVVTEQGDGLYVFDENLNLLKTASSSRPSSYTYQQFTDLLLDNTGKLWILDWLQGDLLLYDKKKNICNPYPLNKLDNFPKNSFNFSTILQDKDGDIWLGTNYAGILKFNPQKKSLNQYIGENPATDLTSKAIISDMVLDKTGRIWISTIYFGIYIFDPKAKKFLHLTTGQNNKKGLRENRVHSLALDKFGNIWAGLYTKGIQVINSDNPLDSEIKLLTFKNGLENENIVNIVSDINKNMWVQTEGGLFSYDYETNLFKKYTDKEGYRDFLNPYGLKSLSSGEICIGASEGFYIFHPDSIHKNHVPPKVVFTGFYTEADNPRSILMNNDIVLPFKDNFFTIDFAALNFQLPLKNSYAYKLEGIDADWVYCNNKNCASYTNIHEGKYIFKVKAANNDNVWNDHVETLNIIILPPWYRTWWAYMVYSIFVLYLIYLFYSYQQRKWKLQTQLQLEHEEAKRLREMDAAKSKIFTNITHEFRTPLTVILGLVDILKTKPKINFKENLNLIKRNGQSLLNLINQLLELSKLETGHLKTEMIHCDIVGYLGYLTESFHSLANKKGIHLNFHSEQETIKMDFDPEKIERILTNLISNAIKFTPEYGKVLVVAKKINISSQDFIQIDIKDNGKGISEEDLKHIFDRFFQEDSQNNSYQEGTGIGLALVDELVKLLAGHIKVESKPDQGTKFSIYLPIQDNAEHKDFSKLLKEDKDISIPKVFSDISPEDKPILLIVEDNSDVVYYLKNILSGDYKIEVGHNGQQGIDKAIEIIPDIIISDVMMPEKDGFELCETLKSNDLTSHIPIILLTAKATAQDRLSGFELGADAYLSKPFNQKELEIRLKKLIENRNKLQEYYANLHKQKDVKDKKSEKETAFITKLNQIVEKNIHDEMFDVNRLSRAMLMSRSQLHRKLKALMDISPAALIKKIRLEKAYKLITETDKPISEIAFELGFTSTSYFSFSFSETYGISPSELRNKSK